MIKMLFLKLCYNMRKISKSSKKLQILMTKIHKMVKIESPLINKSWLLFQENALSIRKLYLKLIIVFKIIIQTKLPLI